MATDALARRREELLRSFGLDAFELIDQALGAVLAQSLPLPRLTPRVRSALTAADAVAREAGHHYISTEHLLLALLQDENSGAARAVSTHASVEALAVTVRAAIDSLSAVTPTSNRIGEDGT